MAMDKSWTRLPNRLCAEYLAGVKAFVERCWDYSDEQGEVRCPCRHCNNGSFQNLDTVEAHLLDWGFQEAYTTWTFHGERSHPDSVDDSDEKTEDENDGIPDSGSGPSDRMPDSGSGPGDSVPDSGSGPGPSDSLLDSTSGPGDTRHLHHLPHADSGEKRKGKRGESRSIGTDIRLKDIPGGKMPIQFDTEVDVAVGTYASSWASEIGQIVRRQCPMQVSRWNQIDKELKKPMIDQLKVKFIFDNSDRILKSIDRQMNKLWRDFRYDLHRQWELLGGKIDPEAVKQKRPKRVRSQADWEYLCNYWSSDQMQKISEKNKCNRGKRKYFSRHGSKSLAAHRYAMKNLSPIDFFRDIHYKAAKGGWPNQHAEKDYEEMIQRRNSQPTQNADGTPAIPMSQEDIIQEVRGKCSSYVHGLGQLPKRDYNELRSIYRTDVELRKILSRQQEEMSRLQEHIRRQDEYMQLLRQHLSTVVPSLPMPPPPFQPRDGPDSGPPPSSSSVRSV